MHFSIKKINYYVKKNGVTIKNIKEDRSAFMEATLTKLEYPNDKIELTMSNLYEVQNPPLFANSFWCEKKRRIELPHSSLLVNDIVSQTSPSTNPWINTVEYSTPVYYADMSTPKVQVYHTGQSGSNFERDMKSVPVHPSWEPATGTDGHITIIDLAAKRLWEFWKFKREDGKCFASWGGMMPDIFNNGVVPKVGEEMRGATATSFPMLGGTILMDELEASVIPHMLAFSLRHPEWSFIPPALRTDGSVGEATGVIPAGQIFQFPEDIVIDQTWTPLTKMMVTAVRDYGMIQRDRSGCFAFYIEDISHRGLGAEPYKAYYGGKALWDVIKQFPFNQLKAVGF